MAFLFHAAGISTQHITGNALVMMHLHGFRNRYHPDGGITACIGPVEKTEEH